MFVFAACGANGSEEERDPTESSSAGPTESSTAPTATGVLVAVAPNPAQPGVEAGPIRLITLEDENASRTIGAEAYFRELAFSPDGRYLAAVGSDDPGGPTWVRLYDVSTGKELASNADSAAPVGIAWAPDGSRLAIVREGTVIILPAQGEPRVFEGVGVPARANPLGWAWTADSEMFGVITEEGLVLLPVVGDEAGTTIPEEQFPPDSADWGLRTGVEPREIGLVDLRPVSGIPNGRAEYPMTVRNGMVEPGEPRVVSIYDWNTLPSPEFDAATNQRFPLVRKTCSPCRSADGGSSLFIAWTADDLPTPAAEIEDWPPGTRTLLAIEISPTEATAIDLGINPVGSIDPPAWRPVYDVAKVAE